jgi:uncharacterized protein (TIGR03437 family)
VVNAASYATTSNTWLPVGKGVSSSSIVSVFGTNLAASTQTASTIPLPTELGGTSVIVKGRPAPLFYVSPTQINFQMPGASEPQDIVVATVAGKSEPYRLDPLGAVGVFTLDASGCGQGVVLNVQRDGTVSVNSPENSVSPGEYISVYGTGLDHVYNSPIDGTPAQSTPPLAIASGWGGFWFDFARNASPGLSWAGRAPGLIGVDQFNLNIDETVREGCAVPVQVASAYGVSQPVTISVRKSGGPCVDPPSAGYGQIVWQKSVTVTPRFDVSEISTFTVSLQSSPGRQVPRPRSDRREYFGPACPLPGYRSLDAGALTIQGPGLGPVQATSVPLEEGQISGLQVYRAVLPPGAIQPGSFNVSAAGGADVGAFQSAIPIGSDIRLTVGLAARVLSRREPLTITWNGGDPDAWVRAWVVQRLGYEDWSGWEYRARASEGVLVMQPSAISGYGVSTGSAELILEITPDQPLAFSAPGLSLGGQHRWKYTYRFQGLVIE